MKNSDLQKWAIQFGFAFAALTMNSCNSPRSRDINCDFKGAIVFGKFDYAAKYGFIRYEIKYNGEIIDDVYACPIDGFYQIGDTINGPCR